MKAHQHILNAAVLGSLIIAFQFSSQAAPGDLDTSFNNVGFARTGFGVGGAFGFATAVQSDGKLVIGGTGDYGFTSLPNEFALARFTTNNLPDLTFGANGRVVTPVGLQTNAQARALVLQTDGKLVLAGYAYDTTNFHTPKIALVRYLTNGLLDTSFGNEGKVIQYPPGANQSFIYAATLQADGKIVVGGQFGLLDTNNNGTNGVLVARFLPNGTLDTSFGNGGDFTMMLPGGYGIIYGLLTLTNGNIVAVGSDGAQPDENFLTMRFTTNGVLDSSFGTNGIVRTYVSYPPYIYTIFAAAHQVVLQPGNPDKLVVVGEANLNTSYYGFAVVRYNMNGTLDTTFGKGGIVTNFFGPGNSYGEGVVVQGPPTTITVGGYGNNTGPNYYWALARLTTNGSYDTSFGSGPGGMVTITFPDSTNLLFGAEALALTTQAGKVVMAGSIVNTSLGVAWDLSAMRFNSNGTVETTYGTKGEAFPGGSDMPALARGLALQRDGKVLVAGSATSPYPVTREVMFTNDFAVARYNSDGTLDSSFGSSGQLSVPVGTNALAGAVRIQPDGKLIMAGGALHGANLCFTVVRCTTNGSIDGSFGSGGSGEVFTQIGTSNSFANALQLQPDSKIVAAGYAMNGTNLDFALARYLTNGTLDPTFGGAGVVTAQISTGNNEAHAMVIQADGKIVAAGYGQDGPYSDFALVRCLTNGTVDPSFGLLGRVTTEFVTGNSSVVYDLAQQTDGRLVAAGSTALGDSTYVALARYNTNGTLDISFGFGGQVITQIGPISDYATSLTLQPDGKILVAALSEHIEGNVCAILRYNKDGTLDQTYGTGGIAEVSFDDGDNDGPCALLQDSSGRVVFAATAGQDLGVARLQADAIHPIALAISSGGTNAITVAWPAGPSGWNLQQCTNLSAAIWTVPPETVYTSGASNYIVVTQAMSTRFFRLVYP